jgi:hypothetical protein
MDRIEGRDNVLVRREKGRRGLRENERREGEGREGAGQRPGQQASPLALLFKNRDGQ